MIAKIYKKFHFIIFFFLLSLFALGQIEFTEEEKEFLKNKGIIKMAVDPDWLPFEKVDEKGKYIGISADFIKLIEKKSNIKIELVPTKDWNESLDLSKRGKVDILPFLNQTSARDKWLIFTEPIFSDSTIIITREETPYIDDLSKLGKKTIVFPAGTSLEERVRRDFPNLDVLVVEKEEDVFKSILDKKAYLTLRSLTVSAYTIRKEGLFNLKISGQVPSYTNHFRIGVTGNQEILRDILNKVIKNITPEEKEEIINNHVYIKREELVNYEPLKRTILIFSFLAFFMLYKNHTQKKENEKILSLVNDLEESHKRYMLLSKQSNTFNLVLDQRGLIIEASPLIEDILKYTRDEVICKKFFYDFCLPEEREEIRLLAKEIISQEKTLDNFEFRQITKEGKLIWLLVNGICIYNKNKEITGFSASYIDITERKETQDALKKSEEKYRLLTEFASDVIWVLNLSKKKFTYVSPTVYHLRGISAEEAINESLEQALSPKSVEIVTREIEKNIKEFLSDPDNPKYYLTEIEQPHKDGSLVAIEVGTKFRYNEYNEIEIVGVSRNINDRKKAEENILYLSYHDQLTGLYNRRFFEEELKRIDTVRNLPISLVMIDINGLKLTNDAFGHLLGDKLLQRAGEILKENFRNDEIIARTGGDEFVVLLPKTSYDDTLKIMERIDKSTKNEKIDHIKVSFSWGIGSKNDIIEDFQEIYKKAENQMYEKKIKNKASIRKDAINTIVNSLYEKIPEEKNHAIEVGNIAQKIADKINLDMRERKILKEACYFHDIGKISISSFILNKASKLNEEEWYLVKKHSQIGSDIIGSSSENALFIKPILHHHEHWDGSGYPDGLREEEIPLLSRIIAIADAFQAMQSDRPYRKALPREKALELIISERGKQFDPQIVDAFMSLFG